MKVSSPLAMPSPVTSAKLSRKKPVPLPRTKCSKTSQARTDLDIYENIGPIKQEEGGDVTLAEYVQSVQSTSTPKPSKRESYLVESEGDTTENTGDSGISEWTGKGPR